MIQRSIKSPGIYDSKLINTALPNINHCSVPAFYIILALFYCVSGSVIHSSGLYSMFVNVSMRNWKKAQAAPV